MSLASNAFLYLSVNAFSCSGVAAATCRLIVTKSARNRVDILMNGLMPATVVGSVSKLQANLQKKNLCESAFRRQFHSPRNLPNDYSVIPSQEVFPEFRRATN